MALEEGAEDRRAREKKATVNAALKKFIARRKRLAALEALATIGFADDFDYEADRKKR